MNADREAHGKKPLNDEDEAPKPRGRKKDNTSRKKQGRRKKEAKKQKTVTVSTVADAAYKTTHICRKVFQDGRVLSTAYKRPQTMKGGHPWWAYVYDEYYDCVICPEYQVLSYRTTNRDGYREYCSGPKICTQCPTRHLCTRSKNCVKTVLRHIWKDYEELADDARYITSDLLVRK